MWYQKKIYAYFLLPLSFLYALIFYFRKLLFIVGVKKKFAANIPVIVVGNITVGGTGKTPLVIYLIEQLRAHGFQPGIISRGYGANVTQALLINDATAVQECGDEPFLIYHTTKAPVTVCCRRVAAAKMLQKKTTANIIISDDGLQHDALKRDVEIVVVDGKRKLGNCLLLPAGPLRELPCKLNHVDYIITNGPEKFSAKENSYIMNLQAEGFYNLNDPQKKITKDFLFDKNIVALTAIGNPERFFVTLKNLQLKFEEKTFPDHYFFNEQDLLEFKNKTIIVTEKDAVKLSGFAAYDIWVLPVRAEINKEFINDLLVKINAIIANQS